MLVNLNYVHMLASTPEEGLLAQDAVLPKSSQECETTDSLDHQMPDNLPVDGSQQESSDPSVESTSQDVIMSDSEISSRVEAIKQNFVERTNAYGIPQLEILYTRVMKGVFETKDGVKGKDLKSSILDFLLKFAEDETKF